jgi:hypothetical protein
LLVAFTTVPALLAADRREHLPLNGEWAFQVDRNDVGRAETWFARPEKISSRLTVPGSWQSQGVGDPVGVIRHHYEGAGWYARRIEVPANWRGKRIDLVVGGAFTYTTAYVNGLPAGNHDGFSTAFRFDVTALLKPGAENLVVFRVANVRNVLQPARRNLDERDTNDVTGALNAAAQWGGIYRDVELQAHDAAWVDRVAITTEVSAPSAEVEVLLRNDGAADLPRATVEVCIGPRGAQECTRQKADVNLPAGAEVVSKVRVAVPGARLWSPESPALYEARVSLIAGGQVADQVARTFGFREIRADGQRFLLNGKPYYLRGYGDDSAEMLTGAPPHSKEVYLSRMRIAKELGFNAVRFHSTTPVEECFQAADEVGMLVDAELPVIYQEYLLPHKELLKSEILRIVDAHRNHPSWFFFTLGNEFGLHRIPDPRGKEVFLSAVKELVETAKQRYPRLLVSSNSGYLVPPMDVAVPYQGVGEGVPNIKHEYGGYHGTLPDFSLIPQFTGVFEPLWLHAAKAWVESKGLTADYPRYLRSSWRLHAIAIKSYIEKLRGTEDFAGYFYWLINDFPGGTLEGAEWNWGWLDLFWKPKHITPADGQQMNAAVLPLIDIPISERSFWLEDGKRVGVLLSNFGDSPIESGALAWELTAGERKLASGETAISRAPLGSVTRIGQIQIGALRGEAALEMQLNVSVRSGGRQHRNRWKLWGFPRAGLMQSASVPVSSSIDSAALKHWFPFVGGSENRSNGVLLASELNPRVMEFLRDGGRVVLLAEPRGFGGRAAYFPGMGGAAGLQVDESHPALRGFPHDGAPDLQFYNLLDGGTRFELDPALTPIVGGLQLTRAKPNNAITRVTFLTEARVGKGRLLFCGLSIRPHLDAGSPEAVYLLDRLLRYAAGAEFQPRGEVAVQRLNEIRVPYTEMIH